MPDSGDWLIFAEAGSATRHDREQAKATSSYGDNVDVDEQVRSASDWFRKLARRRSSWRLRSRL